MNNLKYKSPFIYKIKGEYYALGMHTCRADISQTGIDALESFKADPNMKSFKRVLDLASLASNVGEVDEFISILNKNQYQELEEQYKVFLEYSSHL